MRFREILQDRLQQALAGRSVWQPAGGRFRASPGGQRAASATGVFPKLASPAEHLMLEVPGHRARTLVRCQIAGIVVVSMLAAVLGVLVLALPQDDRPWVLAALGVAVAGGAAVVGLTDYWLGRNVAVLIGTASQLRQSAAERAADLARINAELRRRDGERAGLFATMSHELRTPLSSIIGLSRALLDELDGDLNDEQRADVRQVHQSARGLLGIVNRTLEFARLESGRVALSMEAVQLWPVVEEVVATLRPQALARGLDLDRSISQTLPPVHADEDALRQVLINLVGNAVKFTQTGRISIETQATDHRVTIAVTDTGAGIPSDAHELIFDSYRQLDPGTGLSSGGTGLGLAISRRLVQMMGGSIWVESTPGAGSTFFVSLPAARLVPVEPAEFAPRTDTRADVVVVGEPGRCGPLVASLRSHGLEATVAVGPAWERDVAVSAPRLVLFDALLARAEHWRGLAALRGSVEHRNQPVGIIGLTNGGGRIVLPAALDLLTDADLEIDLVPRAEALLAAQPHHDAAGEQRLLLVSGDAAWRRRVGLILEGRGIRICEAASAESIPAVARRWFVRGLVVDLLLPEPGIASILAMMSDDEKAGRLPMLVVGPAALSPGNLRALRLDAGRWAREAPMPVTDLSTMVARKLSVSATSHVAGVFVVEAAWPAH